MNIYEKLQKCRVELQGSNLKKSGKNTFSNYDYFELGDFLPKINELFKENKLCSIVTFDKEIAKLVIIDSEKPEGNITFTSPMADATLKGCHPIQNMGAVQTYQRRYLYMSALEIVDSDAIDGTIGNKDEKQGNKPICIDCGNEITKTTKSTLEEILAKGQKYYNAKLCSRCIRTRWEASQEPQASGQ